MQIELGEGADFFGATIYRPKDSVMVVENPQVLSSGKSRFGLLSIRRQAEAEGREVICLWPYTENAALEHQMMNRLRAHGLLIETDDAQM